MSLFINDIRELCFSIYVIGYSDQGESILLILKEKSSEKVLYSIVVDCYEEDNLHKTIELLTTNNINNIHLLCWTHPDEDHSKGLLKLINEKCNSSTIFLLPEGVYGKETDVINYNDEDIKVINKINSFNENRNYTVRSVSVHPELCQPILKNIYKDSINPTSVTFAISALAPCSPVLRRRIENEPKKVKKNDFSIALLINIGELQFLLSGDIENQTIGMIGKEYLSDLCFIKTPHHTSKSSNILLKKLDNSNKVSVVCTTVYASNFLPDPDLISEYKKYCEKFHSTGLKSDNGESFGIVEYEFDVVEKEISKLELFGNAIEK